MTDFVVLTPDAAEGLRTACAETISGLKYVRGELQIGPDGEGLDLIVAIDAMIEDCREALDKAEARA